MRILLVGKGSYIGQSLIDYAQKNEYPFEFTELDVLDESWREHSFDNYNVVIQLAAIVHEREDRHNRDLYMKINRDLAVECAARAKDGRATQFIFLSSMSVYGILTGKITKETMPHPTTFYGKSKLEAEARLLELETTNFRVAILRPPMVYGPDCKGNYPRLASIAKVTPIFPDYKNERSMIYIDHLSESICRVINDEMTGIFYPQNATYVSSDNMVRTIAKVHGHKVLFTKLFNWAIGLIKIAPMQKLFGSLIYEREMSEPFLMRTISFEESIRRSENP
jgi:nucleoside-diphosphate-sugar epimerase